MSRAREDAEAPAPQPRFVKRQLAAPATADAPAPDQVSAETWEIAGRQAAMIRGHLPEAFQSAEWTDLIRRMHAMQPPDALAELLVKHAWALVDGEQPGGENLGALFGQDGDAAWAVVQQLVMPLPIAQSEPDYAQALLEAIMEELGFGNEQETLADAVAAAESVSAAAEPPSEEVHQTELVEGGVERAAYESRA